jgi:NAD(P)-dependent dehydrogenase (short-subunit alcohol dehydrogenase family)
MAREDLAPAAPADSPPPASAPGTPPPLASLSESDVAACLRVLEAIGEDRAALAAIERPARERLLRAAGRVASPVEKDERRLRRAFRRLEASGRREADAALLDATGIRAGRRASVFLTPPAEALAIEAPREEAPGRDAPGAPAPGPELREPRSCYVCKAAYRRLHAFYDQLCPACGDLNLRKRTQTAPLDGRVALLTGGRVKIGYQAGILLLRAGARLVVTTRFPRDAAERYAREPDFERWGDRLEVHGLDLRHTPSVELFARELGARLERLDFVVHNACQTVRRPPGFYAHLVEREAAVLERLSPEVRALVAPYEALRERARGLRDPAALSQLALAEEDRALAQPGGGALALFPAGRLDADLQQVDLRAMNSWRLRLHEVPAVELLEVQLVNAVAPFILAARLRPLMARTPGREKHIVNVSAMEGQFARALKTDKHPHTNMAKAALNMLTRTSAQDLVRDGIHMNSVDTGWVTDEDPAAIAARKAREQGAAFHPPLDVVDGAARIVDPIFTGFLTGAHPWGKFFKDYAPTEW